MDESIIEEDVKPLAEQSDEEILALARERLAHAIDLENHIRKAAREDTEFAAGEQWDPADKADRALERRPCITINRMPQSIRQVTNDARQNRPAIRVSPIDDGADVKTAKIRQGLIRNIEKSSNAKVAYDRALAPAVRGGLGFFRVVAGYFDPLSFYQELRIKSVLDPDTCYLDPSFTEPDGSDAEWGFAFVDISKNQFKSTWPKAKLCSQGDWETLGTDYADWVQKDKVRVADYYFREYKPDKLLLFASGAILLQSEEEKALQRLASGDQVSQSRDTLVPIVHHVQSNGYEILERTIWPGRYVPIIPVLGDELVVNGKRVLEGLIRHAKDSQRMYNYQTSNEAETIALAPKAPYIAAAGAFKGYEHKWATANRKNHAFLEYNQFDLQGNQIAPPMRNVQEPPVAAITQARMLAADDIKSTTGIYDSALGAKSNESSGIAIQRRTSQSQTSNYHFYDNLSISIAHAGRILNDAITVIYDAARAVRILGEEGQEEIVRINEEFKYKGELAHFRMDVGKFDVSVDTGPSFETKRQEAAQGMLDFTRSMPQSAAVIADLIAKNLDWPGAQEISERLKKTLPPGIADDKDATPIPPQVKAQMGQMSQMIEQLTEQLKTRTDQIENKTLELESKERIEMAKLQMQAEIKLAELGSVESLAILRSEIAQIEQRMNLLRQNSPIGDTEDSQMAPQYENEPPIQEMEEVDFNQSSPDAMPPGNSMEEFS